LTEDEIFDMRDLIVSGGISRSAADDSNEDERKVTFVKKLATRIGVCPVAETKCHERNHSMVIPEEYVFSPSAILPPLVWYGRYGSFSPV
jgi:hypothetical protein